MRLPYRLSLGREEKLWKDLQAAGSNGSNGYGATEVKRSTWEHRGEPLQLFFEAGLAAGRQLFALLLIIIQVLGPHSHENIMNCDPVRCGTYLSFFCEYTKAYVRCFPLLAMAVSLMIAARMVLNHRLYYQLLKHDLLISFEPLLPSQDSLFRLLLWCLVNALPHFIMNIWLAHRECFHLVKLGDLASSAEKLMAANVLHDAHQVAVFYFIPAVVFLIFLFSSYDTEATLLPLSKFFEDDFEASRTVLNRVRFMREKHVVDYVQKELSPQATATGDVSIGEIFKHLAEAVATDAPVMRTQQGLRAAYKNGEERSQVTWTMWPARILLDPRLCDKDAIIFRCVWYVFLGVLGLPLLFVLYCLSSQMFKDVLDVWNGQISDMAGIVIELGHFIISGHLSWMLYRRTISDAS